MVRSCEITSKSTGNPVIEYKKSGATKQKDLQQRGSDKRQAAECVKDRKQWKMQPRRRQPWVKTDGSNKEGNCYGVGNEQLLARTVLVM